MTTADRPWEVPAPEPTSGPLPKLVGMDREALRILLVGLGEPAWRGDQLYEGLYRHRWASWERFTAFGRSLRDRLGAAADLARPEIVESVASADGSCKHAFRLADGLVVEGVHMPHAGRTTLCLSSQVGCALGCVFCATGRMGILRNLSTGEIVGQVLAMLDHHGHPPNAAVNLVFMGMGEPLHNLDHVMAAFRLLSDPAGLAISPRRITVSTAGLVTGIARLGAFRPRPRLALSLNATTDAERARLMPVGRLWSLAELSAALQAFPLEKGERITLEYVLIKGVTDSLEDGRRLAAFARRFPSKINLIPFNPHEAEAGAEAHGTGGAGGRPEGAAQEGPRVAEAGGFPAPRAAGEREDARASDRREEAHGTGEAGGRPQGAAQEGPRVAEAGGFPAPRAAGERASGFQAPDESRIDVLCALLAKAGLTVSVRRSRGQDVAGACGQLARKVPRARTGV